MLIAEALGSVPTLHKPGMVPRHCDPSILEMEVEEPEVRGHPELHL